MIMRIDHLDDAEVTSEEVFKQMNRLSALLNKNHVMEFKGEDIISQIGKLTHLLKHENCRGIENQSNLILTASNNLNALINGEKDLGLSTGNVLQKISGLTRLLPK